MREARQKAMNNATILRIFLKTTLVSFRLSQGQTVTCVPGNILVIRLAKSTEVEFKNSPYWKARTHQRCGLWHLVAVIIGFDLASA